MKKNKIEFNFLDTPKFSYEYKNEVNVLGRKLIHIGEGIYIFERPFVSGEFSLDQFKEKLKDYKDISFIRFYNYPYRFTNSEKNEEKWIIPFAISATRRRHSRYMWNDSDRIMRYIAGFSIPGPMKRIIDHITENNPKPDKEYEALRAEEIYYDQDWRMEEFASVVYRPVEGECTHLLDFEYDTDDGRYVLVNGFVGRKILDGIYYFDDTIQPADGEAYFDQEDRTGKLHSKYLNPGDFDENIAFIGKEIWSMGTFPFYEGSIIYYMAFGDEAIDVLYRLYKSLSGYEMRFMKKDAVVKKIEPLAIDDAFLDKLDKMKSNKRPINIPEGACELIEGMGFQDLDIRCKLLFQNINETDRTNSDGFRRHDTAYVMDEKLYLIDYSGEKEEGHALSLRMVKELSVRYRVRLFDDVEEDVVQVVIDNGDAEKSILGEEDYNDYLRFVTKRW